MSKANQLYRLSDDGLKGIKAEIQCKAQGGTAEVAIIEGDGGHLDGVLNVAKQGEAIIPGEVASPSPRPSPRARGRGR